MTFDEDALARLNQHLDKLRTHGSKLGPALKKPLLLLHLLAEVYKQHPANPINRFTYDEVKAPLTALIREYGGRGSAPKPEQPFYHLSSSDLWNLQSDHGFEYGMSKTATVRELSHPSTFGSFDEGLFQELVLNRDLCLVAIDSILERWWPSTLHVELKHQLGVADVVYVSRTSVVRKRDAAFREATLKNYREKCAACGLDLLFLGSPAGVDACHIHWHAHGGQDSVENGIALCKFHHWALDKGIFTVRPDDHRMAVSPHALARCSVGQSMISSLDGRPISRSDIPPDERFLEWHRANIFRS